MALDTEEKRTPAGRETDEAFDQIDNADLRDQLGTQESNPDTGATDPSNENPMNFMNDDGASDERPSGRKRASSWLSRNKRSIAGGGGAIVLIAGLFGLAAPMKLQGILDQIGDVSTGRLQHYVEKRATKLFSQSILQRFGIVDDRNIVKHGSIIERLGKTMATNKYEERLAQKGIKFVANKEGDKVVSVSIELVGENTDEAKQLLKKVFTHADDLEAALDGNVVSKKILKSIIKQDMGIWGYLVRGKLSRWMTSYLGIKRFGTEKTSSNSSPEDKIKNQAVSDVVDSLEAQGKALENGMDVMTTAENIGGAKDVPSTEGVTAAKSSVIDNASSALGEAKTAISSATNSTITKVITTVSEKLGIKLAEGFAEKVGTKVIPVYGEVVLAATAVVFAHWLVNNVANGNASRAIAMPAAVLMGFSYAKWAGYASQAKEGTLDTDLYNYFTPFLDGVETSSLYNCVDKEWKSGCDTVGEPAYKKLNETSSQLVTDVTKMAAASGYMLTGDYSPTYLLSRLIFNLDNYITGFAMDAIVRYFQAQYDFSNFLSDLVVPKEVRESAQQSIKNNAEALLNSAGQFAMQGLLNIFGLNISPTMGGNKLYDILLNGGVYSSNRYMETSLAMHQIDIKTAAAQTQRYLAEERQYNKDQGVMYALFSPEASDSITSNLVNKLSYGGGFGGTASNAVSSLFGLVKSTPTSLASTFVSSASAASFTAPETVLNAIPFGISDAEADANINSSVLAGEACSSGATDVTTDIAAWFGISSGTENQPFNNCALDTSVAQSMLCSLDSSITESAECNPDAGGSTSNASAVTSGSCPTGTNVVSSITKGWDRSGNEKAITLCSIPGTKMSTVSQWKDSKYQGTSAAGVNEIAVNAQAASSLLQASQRAEQFGVTLSASVAYRSLYEQCSIYLRNHARPSACPDWTTAASSGWSTTVLYSNHLMGYSIDFDATSENWMRSCARRGDGGTANRCYNFWDDVQQKEHWDSAHFTYDP